MTRKANASVRLREARSEAAKELKLPASDWRVRRYAILTTAYSNAEGILAEGATIDIKQLLEIEAALVAIKASLPPEQVKVAVQIMSPPQTKCPDCGTKFNPEGIDEKPAPPRQIEGLATEATPSHQSLSSANEARRGRR
jgi:hypothetical protein